MCGLTMAGFSPTPQVPRVRAAWPRELRRAAVLLSAGSVLYWLAFAYGGWTIWIDGVGIIYMDLLLAWGGVLLNVLAWPDLWDGLRDLVAAHPEETDALVARRSFFTTLALVAGAVIFLPLQYHVTSANQAWVLILYISAFPFLAWIFIPTLALHGILFGRTANYLDAPSRRLAEAGIVVLFSVAAAPTPAPPRGPGPPPLGRPRPGPRRDGPAHDADAAEADRFSTMLRRKTIQVESPRQTKSKGFYNTVSFLQQHTSSILRKLLITFCFREAPHGLFPPRNG